jgi:hypothetical protein
MGAAARSERWIIVKDGKTPHQRGFVHPPRSAQPKTKGRENSRPFFNLYQFRKQRRPNGPECQPDGQLYIGRHPP